MYIYEVPGAYPHELAPVPVDRVVTEVHTGTPVTQSTVTQSEAVTLSHIHCLVHLKRHCATESYNHTGRLSLPDW